MSDMYSYITETYASILTKRDVLALFGALMEHYGNRSRAAERVGVTSPTTYGWEDATFIKSDTKKKVLHALLEEMHLYTLEYLLNITSDRQIDILRTKLIFLYNAAVIADERTTFCDLLNKYEDTRKHFIGTIRDNIDEEVRDMKRSLQEVADELDVPLPEPSIDELSARDIVDSFPLVALEFRSNQGNPAEAARNLGLPLQSIETFWESFRSVRPSISIKREVEVIGHTTDHGSDILGMWMQGVGPCEAMVHKETLLKPILSSIGMIYGTRTTKTPTPMGTASAYFGLHDAGPAIEIECLTVQSAGWNER